MFLTTFRLGVWGAAPSSSRALGTGHRKKLAGEVGILEAETKALTVKGLVQPGEDGAGGAIWEYC